MTAHDDPRNVDKEAPTDRSAGQTTVLHELTEALTALGNYLEAAQRQFENRQEVLGETLRASLGQYERVAECLHRLRTLIYREAPQKP
jgi:phosphoglycerate-specific signal transduction histidine kinase